MTSSVPNYGAPASRVGPKKSYKVGSRDHDKSSACTWDSVSSTFGRYLFLAHQQFRPASAQKAVTALSNHKIKIAWAVCGHP